MTDSILDSVKTALGVSVEQTDFDPELMIYINSVFSTLTQLGVGPVAGFSITDKNQTWEQFLGTSLKMNDAKTYMVLRVKMLFDPPATGPAIAAFQEQVKETAWRLNTEREATSWVHPDPVLDPDTVVIDGGIG